MNTSFCTLDIIVPFYERIDFLKVLFNYINSSYIPYKKQVFLTLIVVNDSPWEKGKLDKLTNSNSWSFDLKVLNQEINQGVAPSRELGIANSSGDWIMLLDQDDELAHDFFKTLLLGIQKNVDFILMNGFLIHNNPPLKFPIYIIPPTINLPQLIKYDFIRSPGQVFFKRKLISNFSFPKPKYRKGCDDRFLWILIFLFNKNIKSWYSNQKNYIGNIHGGNFGLDSSNLYACSLELWNELDQFNFGENRFLVENNKILISHILNEERSLKSFVLYLKYKFELNKLIKFTLKKFSRVIKIYN